MVGKCWRLLLIISRLVGTFYQNEIMALGRIDTVGWSEIALFEIGHIAAVQIYLYI